MLSKSAFNALLKTLEEPPAHVFFMFATTELHKVPITILSRCQRYELKRVVFAELVAFFAKLAKEEGVAISDRALEMIATEAEGSVRDGLSLLDQIFSFGGEEVSDLDVTQVLGLVDRTVFHSLAAALLVGDLGQCLALLDRCYSSGIDLKRFANDLLAFFRAMLVMKTAREPEALLDMADRELAAVRELAAPHSAETLYSYFHLLLEGIEAMQYASRPRLVLEMAFIRAAQAGSVTPVADLLGRLDDVLRGVTPVPAPAPGVGRPAADVASFAVTSSEPVPAGAGARPAAVVPTLPAAQPVPPPAADPSPAPAVEPARPQPVARAQPKEVRRHWEEFIAYVKERKQWMAHSLRLSDGAREEAGELVIKFEAVTDCKVLQDPENMKFLTEFAQDFFQKELRVRISVRGAEPGTAVDDGRDELQEERRVLANDPLVQVASEVFNAQVVGIRTGPRSR